MLITFTPELPKPLKISKVADTPSRLNQSNAQHSTY
jgi:hypothetical protein